MDLKTYVNKDLLKNLFLNLALILNYTKSKLI